MNCRLCNAPLSREFLDLGSAPASNSFIPADALDEPEVFYPLRLHVCDRCLLVQVDEHKRHAEIFGPDYAYFSSFSRTWLDHARAYVDMIVPRLGLTRNSLVVEIASNDGYLLQYVRQRGIPCLGVEPTANTAAVARGKGIEVVEDFFGPDLARSLAEAGRRADLVIGNNVLAHVPDLNGFVSGLPVLLKPGGTATFEFPHLLRLVQGRQFDTVYHEHFSYFSLHALQRLFTAHGLAVANVEELSTHGGSLRVYARHAGGAGEPDGSVAALLEAERAAGMLAPDYYAGFQAQADRVKDDLLHFLIAQKRAGRSVAAYGAAAKGNTLLNYCGVRRDLVAFVADASPRKQGCFLPGSRIPVLAPEAVERLRPDFVLILPWNIQEEIMQQLSFIRSWGGRFVTAIPGLSVL